jgi:hypothetical protein
MNISTVSASVTAVVIATALLGTVAKSKGWRFSDLSPQSFARSLKPVEKTPEDAIFTMLDAARLADPQAFLDCYSGQLKDQLSQTEKESGEAKFATYLKTSNVAVQGVVVSTPQPEADGFVKVRVEYVYRDRNEVQFVYLSKVGSAWKISKVDGSERVKTLVPFGTAVSD